MLRLVLPTVVALLGLELGLEEDEPLPAAAACDAAGLLDAEEAVPRMKLGKEPEPLPAPPAAGLGLRTPLSVGFFGG